MIYNITATVTVTHYFVHPTGSQAMLSKASTHHRIYTIKQGLPPTLEQTTDHARIEEVEPLSAWRPIYLEAHGRTFLPISIHVLVEGIKVEPFDTTHPDEGDA
jgi:hypothetical protein